ncbi:copper chaperone PCu(A)C [Hydromonas duriensis]|uniref:Copper(I)-binding protein n=1 Tax=Hydromonas duriensis TaxID=1527608 RepID=A0A4R6Y7H6_9BURK|nr:copper chaperone PCu(A)C [Hydromonas duriensis]TDR31277.1 hypothetical protein DFR44_11140 [Hydromonas duriensis]
MFKIPAIIALAFFTLAAHAKITVNEPWARATVDGQTMGGAFLTLTNDGNDNATLIGAQSPVAEKVELHIMSNHEGMMHMQATSEIQLPAHQTVTLAPKSTHIMLMGLKNTLRAGETVPLTLLVKQKGRTQQLRVQASVKALGQ